MKSSRFQIALAQPEDNRDICRLFRIPFAGEISLAMEREPDYFSGSKIQYEEPETYVCRDRTNNRMAACFSVGKRSVFLNGRKTPLRYHSDLRIDPDYQKTSALFDICSYFKKHIDFLEGFSQTVVFSDNEILKGLIDYRRHLRLRAIIPLYVSHGRYVTHTIIIKKKKWVHPYASVVRQAREEDIPRMQEFFDHEAKFKQFYPCYDFSRLKENYYHGLKPENYFVAFKNSQLVGMAGIWNQQDVKQTRIVQYSRRLKVLKHFINPLVSLCGGFVLPDEGTKLNSVMLHTIVTQNNAPEIFKSLVQAVYEYVRTQNYKYMLCGLDERDGLNEALEGYAKREVRGTHYLVSYDENVLQKIHKGIFYLEAARI